MCFHMTNMGLQNIRSFFKDGEYNVIHITYPSDQQDKYGPITTRIVDSFKVY